MRGGVFEAVIVALAMALGSCAATTTTSKVAVDYNRIFADARNEVLVTNILRASEREPLQFSTMGSVTGGVRNTGSIDLSIPSLIGKGATILSPDILVNEGINPTVSIVPLSNKEFTEGILRPVTVEEINYFLNQGWDKELVLELVVGGVVCPDGNAVFNRGDREDNPQYDAFARMFASADQFPIQGAGPPEKKVIRMSASDAVAVMKGGVGSAGSIVAIDPVTNKGKPIGDVEVTIATMPPAEFTGLRTTLVCGGKAATAHPAPPTEGLVAIASTDGQPQAKVILRSPEAIIYFLGETQWWRWSRGYGCSGARPAGEWPLYYRERARGRGDVDQLTLLSINKVCGNMPVAFRTFVQTHFNGADYYLLRQADAPAGDRSLSTLSLLDELIALQTSEATITAGAPLIAIGAR